MSVEPVKPAYTYKATVARWVDGDTVDLCVDCGFHLSVTGRFRLYGIDTPERGQANYVEARQANEALAPAGSTVVVKTYRASDKYGRFLALIYAGDVCINESLVTGGLARGNYFGGSKA